MSSSVPKYAGRQLPAYIETFLAILRSHGFSAEASGRTRATIRILYGEVGYGYINGDVLDRKPGGVLGYRFTAWGHENDACPPDSADRLEEVFCARYGCEPSDLVLQRGTGSNTGRTFLVIRNPTIALQILLRDTHQTVEEDLHITKVGEIFVEGALRDVVMQGHERSARARDACLAHYGYRCFACKANLRQRYRCLPIEVIHVHHAKAIADTDGPHTVDSIANMEGIRLALDTSGR